MLLYDIETKNLSVNYGSVCALKDINLKVKKNEFLGIIGPNGGGKTTLLKVLLGIIKPTTGIVNINRDKKIGYVPQFTHFDRSFPVSVLDVILMGRLPKKMSIFHKYNKSDKEKAEKILNELNIIDLKNRQIGKLSGGQLQKVLIARALITNPDIIILDEPTASIDSKTKLEIYDILKRLNKQKTIIIVSHDMKHVFSYIDSVACVNKTLHYHGNDNELNDDILEDVYGCPVKIFMDSKEEHNNLLKPRGKK